MLRAGSNVEFLPLSRRCRCVSIALASLLFKKGQADELYNARPTWLDLAHKRLDEAVLAAYEWKSDLSDEEILEKLLPLNLERAAR